jgi:RNA polymerase sigma-70 factor (ECF subfamily)|tara:strand:- start:524 stop:1036 length:513 start_codon:yes stop_codon:yes gene_type:complete
MSTLELNNMLVQYQNPLRFYALKLTADEEQANDLLQDTNIKALLNKDKIESSISLKSWLYTIMKNTFINQYRRSVKLTEIKTNIKHQAYLSFPTSTLFLPADKTIAIQDIKKEIKLLKKDYRIPFQMKLEGFKYKEIADHMEINIGTVKSRVFHARKELMSKLKEFNPNV